ncbi:hypothetical protein [Pararhodobacter sp. SW119]|uniref:hypothetical protein n=1 Tax=Pararhodobacter sp. SW119 TaxID=2780075 RepID=UPI001ADFF93B|nr:hypothetical protein [Pararhodobacter sp. SW119]
MHPVDFAESAAAVAILLDPSSQVARQGNREPERQPQEDRAKLRLAQRLLDIGVWDMEIETGRLIWSDNVYSIGVRAAVFASLSKLTADRSTINKDNPRPPWRSRA